VSEPTPAGLLTRWLPAGSAARRFLAILFIDASGTGLFLAGSAIFFTRTLGLSATVVGVGLSLSGVAGLLGLVPIGRLADRFGPRNTLIALNLWRGFGFMAYPFIHGSGSFMVLAFLIGIGEWAVPPIVQATVGAMETGNSPVQTMGTMAAVKNVGFTAGAVLATGVLALHNERYYSGLIVADALTFFLAAAMLMPLRIPARPMPPSPPPEGPGVRVLDLRFLLLTALNGVLYLHTTVLSVGLPLWIATRTKVPTVLVGVVIVVNTVLAILLQARLSRGSGDLRSSGVRQNWAGWCLAACCLLAAATQDRGGWTTIVLVVVAAATLTFGEMWQSAGAWGLSYALSPLRQRSYYLSVYNLGPTASGTIGPALITYGVVGKGAFGWIGLAAVFALAGTAVRLVARAGRPHNAPVSEPVS
jgi:MFS family permease